MTVMSIDLAKSHDLIDGLIKLVKPHETAGLANPVIMEQQGLSLRKDLLANVDSRIAFYTQSLNHDELKRRRGPGSLTSGRIHSFSADSRQRSSGASYSIRS